MAVGGLKITSPARHITFALLCIAGGVALVAGYGCRFLWTVSWLSLPSELLITAAALVAIGHRRLLVPRATHFRRAVGRCQQIHQGRYSQRRTRER